MMVRQVGSKDMVRFPPGSALPAVPGCRQSMDGLAFSGEVTMRAV
jgi:hypothetical protein